jgi:hypothetical protein
VVIQVDPEALTGHAQGLAGSHIAPASPALEPPAADPVTLGAAAMLVAHTAALAAVVEHSVAVRVYGGSAVGRTAAYLAGADADNAGTIAGVLGSSATAGAGGASAATPSVGAPPPAPVIPSIPAAPAVAPLTGEQWSRLLYSGPGAAGLRQFATALQTHASSLDQLADQTQSHGRGINAHWADGLQQAGANTIRHGQWLTESATRARTIAAAAHSVADAFDAAKNATPSPQEFIAARNDLAVAQGSRNPSAVATALNRLSELQAQALDATQGTYQPSASAATSTLGEPLRLAPAIAQEGAVHSVGSPLNDGTQAIRFTPLPSGPITWCLQPGGAAGKFRCSVLYPSGKVEVYWSLTDDSGGSLP